MKLYDKLPNSIVFNGKRVRLNLGFKNVLRMIDTLCRNDLTIEARDFLALKCVCRHPKKGMLPAVKHLLFPNMGEKHTGNRITDYEQDAELIIAAFRQTYGIDLFTSNIHWFEFNALLSALPAGNRYTDILHIRAKPIPSPTKYNIEERNWLIKAKAEYAVKLSDEEREQTLSKSISNVYKYLVAHSMEGE